MSTSSGSTEETQASGVSNGIIPPEQDLDGLEAPEGDSSPASGQTDDDDDDEEGQLFSAKLLSPFPVKHHLVVKVKDGGDLVFQRLSITQEVYDDISKHLGLCSKYISKCGHFDEPKYVVLGRPGDWKKIEPFFKCFTFEHLFEITSSLLDDDLRGLHRLFHRFGHWRFANYIDMLYADRMRKRLLGELYVWRWPDPLLRPFREDIRHHIYSSLKRDGMTRSAEMALEILKTVMVMMCHWAPTHWDATRDTPFAWKWFVNDYLKEYLQDDDTCGQEIWLYLHSKLQVSGQGQLGIFLNQRLLVDTEIFADVLLLALKAKGRTELEALKEDIIELKNSSANGIIEKVWDSKLAEDRKYLKWVFGIDVVSDTECDGEDDDE